MKDTDLLIIMIAFLIGCCFQKIMCNNSLIEGEEIGGGEIKKTCANINAAKNPSKGVKYPCTDGNTLYSFPDEIECKSKCTHEECCHHKKDDGETTFLAFVGIICVVFLIICGIHGGNEGWKQGLFGGVCFLGSLFGLFTSISYSPSFFGALGGFLSFCVACYSLFRIYLADARNNMRQEQANITPSENLGQMRAQNRPKNRKKLPTRGPRCTLQRSVRPWGEGKRMGVRELVALNFRLEF